MTEMIHNLTGDEIEFLRQKKRKGIIGYNAFLGQVMNNAYNLGKEPMYFLKRNVQFIMTVEKMLEENEEVLKL